MEGLRDNERKDSGNQEVEWLASADIGMAKYGKEKEEEKGEKKKGRKQRSALKLETWIQKRSLKEIKQKKLVSCLSFNGFLFKYWFKAN